jgi:ribosomal protein S19
MAHLSENANSIPLFSQELRKNRHSRKSQIVKTLTSTLVRISPRHHGRSTRLADGNGHVPMFKSDALIGQTVKIRSCAFSFATVGPDCIPVHVVGSDEKKVGARFNAHAMDSMKGG